MKTATKAHASKKRAAKKAAPSPERRGVTDELETYIQERTGKNPNFPRLLQEAAERKRLLKELASARRAAGLSQTAVAAKMRTSTSAVARLEQGESNPTVATVQRFASALGMRVEWRVRRGG